MTLIDDLATGRFRCSKCRRPISYNLVRDAWVCLCTVWITGEQFERERPGAPLRVVPRDE